MRAPALFTDSMTPTVEAGWRKRWNIRANRSKGSRASKDTQLTPGIRTRWNPRGNVVHKAQRRHTLISRHITADGQNPPTRAHDSTPMRVLLTLQTLARCSRRNSESAWPRRGIGHQDLKIHRYHFKATRGRIHKCCRDQITVLPIEKMNKFLPFYIIFLLPQSILLPKFWSTFLFLFLNVP